MSSIKYGFKRLSEKESDVIGELFVSVFEKEPWNDDWSNENQLKLYIHDLVGQSNSLTFGLYEKEELIGISMGRIRRWYSGSEYYIDELCISASKQGRGIGSFFIEKIQEACKGLGLSNIFLLTDKDAPAFEFYKKRGFHEAKNITAFSKRL